MRGVEVGGSEEPEAWTQWRGTGRDAVIPEFIPPAPWPEALNLMWSAEGGELFGILQKRKGQLFTADARTGALHWSTEGRSGENGFTVVAGDVVLFLMNEGELIVARRTHPGLEPEHRYTVADAAVWSYPVLLDGGILVKAGSMLSLWSFD